MNAHRFDNIMLGTKTFIGAEAKKDGDYVTFEGPGVLRSATL